MIIDYTDIIIDVKSSIFDQKNQHKFIKGDEYKSYFVYYNEDNFLHKINEPAIHYKNNDLK